MRERVLRNVLDMLEHLRITVGMYHPDELEVLKVIERPQQYEVGVDVANFVMAKLGHKTAPSEPRFDKTRRMLKKPTGRPPKGLTAEERADWYKEPVNATSEA